jgi:nicotinate dehydrogenase subunit A
MVQVDAAKTKVLLNVNGHTTTIEVDDPAMPLLYALRNGLGLHGPRFGCGLAQCGACTVHLDGESVRSCVTPLSAAAGKHVLTLEGLGNPENSIRSRRPSLPSMQHSVGTASTA